MKASEIVSALQADIAQHGDRECYVSHDVDGNMWLDSITGIVAREVSASESAPRPLRPGDAVLTVVTQ